MVSRKSEVMELWRICFGDSEEFIRFYFDGKYRDENAVTYSDDTGRTVAALQMIPYSMSYCSRTISTAYISGACTLPEMRSKGIMKELLDRSFIKMRERDIPLSILIPQDDWLIEYYRKIGYAPVFEYGVNDLTGISYVEDRDYSCDKIMPDDPRLSVVYDYFNSRMRERRCCIQHDYNDFYMIVKELVTSDGALIVVWDNDNVVGVAFSAPLDGKIVVKDAFYDSNIVEQLICEKIAEEWGDLPVEWRVLPTDKSRYPYGMARIVDVEKMLSLYAVENPKLSLAISVNDSRVAANSGCFIIKDGKIAKIDRLSTKGLILSIGELTQLLLGFHPERVVDIPSDLPTNTPFMSLMLD